MLGAVLSGPNDLKLQELPTPSPGPGEVLVKVGANTICGTDGRILRGEKTSGVRPPVVLGHEAAGHVAEVGPGVTGYEGGAPVALMPGIPCRRCWQCTHDLENVCVNKRILGYAVNGGLAEYLLVPAESVDAGCVFVAGSDLPSEQLALAEPLGCIINGQRLTPVEVGDTVLIMGAGPIGLLHLQLSLLAGARAVIVSQRSAGRRAHAERLGATVTVDPTSEDLAAVAHEVSRGIGIDVAIICIGVPELVNEALRLVRTGGRVNVFAGLKGAGWAQVEANLIHYKQIVLTGSSDLRRSDYRTALELIESGTIDTASMVTHRFPLSAVDEALDAVTSGDAIKVAVMPSLREEKP
jgi:L-iditol 2-dehydrogenase